MNSSFLKLTGIMTLLMGLAGSSFTLAEDVVVGEVTPDAAPPATYGLDVVISGSGFDKSAKVNFLKTDTDEPADIVVRQSKVSGSSQINVNIDILDTAKDQDEYYIEVKMSRGRGGKGTTFKVDSTATVAPNNDGLPISMICTVNEDEEPLVTVGNDFYVNPESGIGSWLYADDLEKVLCNSGGVVSDRLAGLRFRTDGGGNPRNSIRFIDLNFSLAAGDCTAENSCTPADPELISRLPAEWLTPSPDPAQIDVRPYADASQPHDHIHLMAPSLLAGPYGMLMQIEPKGLSERYLIQMSNRDSLPEGMLQSHSCRFNAQNVTDDITVYIWRDGVFSGVSDGLPDGYTVTTGTISDPETVGSPPKVTPGFAQGLVCSNVSIDGASCPGGKKQKNALCHALGKVPMKFTMHMEYQ